MPFYRCAASLEFHGIEFRYRPENFRYFAFIAYKSIGNFLLLKARRVVFCFGSLELGGAERQGLLLAEYLKTVIGAHVEVWGFHGPGRLSALCDAKEIPWRIVPFPLAQRGWAALKAICSFSALLREEKVDVLIPYTTMPNLVCALSSVFGRVRACAWNQRDEGLERFAPWVENLALRIAQPIIANSEASACFLTDIKGISTKRIFVVHNGVKLASPLKSRQAWRQDLGVGEDVPLVAMIANVSAFKDHETLVRAWKYVQTASGRDSKLLLAGNQANDEAAVRLHDLIVELELQDSVHMLGRVDDIAGLLDAVDLVVHSSRSEGSPNAVIEAMCAGKALIGTDIPGIREALGDAGPYVPVGDVSAMENEIRRYLADDDLRKAAGDKNKKRAEEQFSVIAMSERMTKIIADEIR